MTSSITFDPIRENITNARIAVIKAQRKLLILERAEKIQKIQTYVTRADASFLTGSTDYNRSLNRLLDAVLLKFERYPFPPLSSDAHNEILDCYEQDSSTVTSDLDEQFHALDASRHLAINEIVHHVFTLNPQFMHYLQHFGLNEPDELYEVSATTADEVLDFFLRDVPRDMITGYDELEYMMDTMEPLMHGEDTVDS